ncbi:hypothetical protein JZ751_013574 [Albula glossodonta]|uniref:Uncharacterized protein n=1 Tax=Albula glossodonta TaxID=121402 RepID=A0A8T2NVU8_9TELE|nr:hypothetical protein JZ751_013574 [Albula glossodonta]
MDMLGNESFSCEGCLRYTQACVGACRSHSSATGSTFTGDQCHRPQPSLCQLDKSPPSTGSPVGMKVLLLGSQLHIRRKHSEHPCALLLCFCCRGWLFSHAEDHNVSASPAPDRGNVRNPEVRCLKTWRGETALQVEGGRASADRRQVQHGFEPTTSNSVKGGLSQCAMESFALKHCLYQFFNTSLTK